MGQFSCLSRTAGFLQLAFGLTSCHYCLQVRRCFCWFRFIFIVCIFVYIFDYLFVHTGVVAQLLLLQLCSAVFDNSNRWLAVVFWSVVVVQIGVFFLNVVFWFSTVRVLLYRSFVVL
jgi:hypothetical protein